jgi:hypothetical protein
MLYTRILEVLGSKLGWNYSMKFLVIYFSYSREISGYYLY